MRLQGGLGAAGSHLAMFPMAPIEAVLTAFSDPGDLFYESFCGSGTQIFAAERAGWRCFAMELGPAYCDVAVRRDGETVSATKLDSSQAKQPTRRVDLPRSVAPNCTPIDLTCFF